MSQPRFAPITAGLLARKGEAAPLASKQPLAWLHEVPMPDGLAQEMSAAQSRIGR